MLLVVPLVMLLVMRARGARGARGGRGSDGGARANAQSDRLSRTGRVMARLDIVLIITRDRRTRIPALCLSRVRFRFSLLDLLDLLRDDLLSCFLRWLGLRGLLRWLGLHSLLRKIGLHSILSCLLSCLLRGFLSSSCLHILDQIFDEFLICLRLRSGL